MIIYIFIQTILLYYIILENLKIYIVDRYLFIMKAHINISLDVEVAELLQKEKNQSGLINAYLRHYYGLTPKTLEQVEQEEVHDIFNAEGL